MSAKAGRHSLERNQGFMPTEALSAQRLLGEEGKGGWGREREGSCFSALETKKLITTSQLTHFT